MTDTRDAELTYAPGDCVAYLAPKGTALPTDFSDLASPYICLGWLTQDGATTKKDVQTKQLLAAGSLYPIRVLTTSKTTTIDVVSEEPMNPMVISLRDDVPLASLEPTAGIVAYDEPLTPSNTRYVLVIDTYDGDYRMRKCCPEVQVTTVGDEKDATTDAQQPEFTFTCFPGEGGVAAISRLVDFGTKDVSRFFS